MSSGKSTVPDGADWATGSLEAQLVDVALTRLATVPAERLSMRKLAAEIGVSHQAPYTHFRSRTRFLAAVAGTGLAAVASGAREAVGRAGSDPLERMLALADNYVTFIERRPHLFDLAYGPSIQMRDHRALQTAAIAYWTLLRDVVGACQPAMSATMRFKTGARSPRAPSTASHAWVRTRRSPHRASIPARTRRRGTEDNECRLESARRTRLNRESCPRTTCSLGICPNPVRALACPPRMIDKGRSGAIVNDSVAALGEGW